LKDLIGKIKKMNKEDVIKMCEIIKDIFVEKTQISVDEVKVDVDDESLDIIIQYEEPEIYGNYHAGYKKSYKYIYIYFDEILERINK